MLTAPNNHVIRDEVKQTKGNKMTIQFTPIFEDGQVEKLTIFANVKKTPIHFWANDGEIHSVTIDNDHCFDATDEALHEIFVGVGDKMHSLYELMLMAGREVEELNDEEASEIKAEEEHRAYVSNPYLTGRI